jgi:hypothetical protein
MSKIIDLQKHNEQKKYSETIGDTHLFLDKMQEKIRELMVNISVQGVWKETFDKYKEGDIFNFTQDMLENTGDFNIEIMWELYYKIDDVRERLKDYLIIQKNN